MSSNSSGYTPRAISDRSTRDSGYASSSSSTRTRSIKKISNSRYDRMTAEMEEVASGSNLNNSKGGKSLGVETIKIVRKPIDNLRGSVQGNKKRNRSIQEMEGVDETEVVENVDEWWEKQEIEKKAKRRRKAQNINYSGPGASVGSLGREFKLMSRENNYNYEDSSLAEENFDDLDDQSSFHMEIQKVYSPSGSGRSRTVVRDKRIDESEESEAISTSKTIVPPWLRQDPPLPTREKTLSPAPPWLANHLYKPAQTIISEPLFQTQASPNIYHDYDQSSTYIKNELDLTSSAAFKAPPFSTSGREFSMIQSPVYREPPRPFYEAQISKTNAYNSPSIHGHTFQNDSEYPRQALFTTSRADDRPEILSSSSPILPSRHTLPPTPPRDQPLHSNSCSSLSQPAGNSNFDFYQSTEDFLSETRYPSREFRSQDIVNSIEKLKQEDTLSSFWKDAPNVRLSIQEPSKAMNYNRDQYSTRLLRGASAYSTHPDTLYSDSFNPDLQKSTFQTLRRTSPKLLLPSRNPSAQSRSCRDSITPIQPLSHSQSNRPIDNYQNPVSIDAHGKDEDEDLWNAVDGIVNDSVVSEKDMKIEDYLSNDDERGEGKENADEQLLIEGLKFDWDQDSEVISGTAVEVESRVDMEDIRGADVEEEIDVVEEEDAWVPKSQEEIVEEEGLGFHIYEDETDPIQEFDYNK